MGAHIQAEPSGTLDERRAGAQPLADDLQAVLSELKVQVGTIMDMAPDRREGVIQHNQRAIAGGPLPLHLEADSALFTVLNTNHATMTCLYALRWPATLANQGLGITTPDGIWSLSMLEQSHPALQ